MKKITNEICAKINTAEELLKFLFLNINMLEPESESIFLSNLHDYIKTVLYIIDFDKNFEYSNLCFYTTSCNDDCDCRRQYDFENIIKSYKLVGLKNVANIIEKTIEKYTLNEKNIDKNEKLEQETFCNKIEEEFSVIDEEFWFFYWKNVIDYLNKEKNKIQ